eukprot:6760824-Pyramimonas_sp.AAC.1
MLSRSPRRVNKISRSSVLAATGLPAFARLLIGVAWWAVVENGACSPRGIDKGVPGVMRPRTVAQMRKQSEPRSRPR